MCTGPSKRMSAWGWVNRIQRLRSADIRRGPHPYPMPNMKRSRRSRAREIRPLMERIVTERAAAAPAAVLAWGHAPAGRGGGGRKGGGGGGGTWGLWGGPRGG